MTQDVNAPACLAWMGAWNGANVKAGRRPNHAIGSNAVPPGGGLVMKGRKWAY